VDIGAIVARVIESSRIGTNREFQVAVADDLPQVQADPDKLVQVITNLVENAVRHGEGMTSVTLDQDSGMVRLVVDDEGDGIPEEIRNGCSRSSGSTASAAAPASACTSSTVWSRCTTGRWRSGTRQAVGPDHGALAGRHVVLTESRSQRVPVTS
jgi:hypothetical protein